MDFMLVALISLILCCCLVLAMGAYKGRCTAKKVIIILDEISNDWESRGLSKDEINKHLESCVQRIKFLNIRDYTEKEFICKCEKIVASETEFIKFN